MYTTTPPFYSKKKKKNFELFSTCNLLYTQPRILHHSILSATHPLAAGAIFSPSALFSFWTQMATTSLSSIHGRTETHQSAFVGEQKRKNGGEKRSFFFFSSVLELQPRSRPFDPSPLCLYTTPDGLPHHHHPGKRRRRSRRTNVSANAHNRHYIACLHLCIERLAHVVQPARRPLCPGSNQQFDYR